MFQRRLNELRVRIRINVATPSPLLVKEGGEGSGSGAMLWVKTRMNGVKTEYIPGSSIRGILRTDMTQIISRWCPEWTVVSDPFQNAPARWVDMQRARHQTPDSASIYAIAGPIERCLGMTGLKGRWTIDDAPVDTSTPVSHVIRPGLGIDRDTGANRPSLTFKAKAIDKGSFATTITLVNYELWQLGLLAHALYRLDSGKVRLGYGSRRGFGRVRVSVASLAFRWHGHMAPQPNEDGTVPIPSLASLATMASIRGDYGWRDENQRLTLPLTPHAGIVLGREWRHDFHQANEAKETDWSGPPWNAMGRLLPEIMNTWEPCDDVLQVARKLQEKRGSE